VILFAHVPNFYAEVECMRDASLRGHPVVVGGDPGKRGRVQSASPDAVAAGVEPGMTMQDALGRCPEARFAVQL
jgi:DNA polymerase-4